MELKEFEEEMNKMLIYNNIELDNNQIITFYNYMQNLLDWNKKINLTAIKNEKEIILKHFIDSLSIYKNLEGTRILDIGSGAGFPGIPLKIKDRKLDVVLIDSINKKVNFMKDTINKLNLNKIDSKHIRAEDMAHDIIYREKFDTVVSRAVANLSTLAEYMLPFVRIDGICICMKGPNSEEEIEKAKNAIKLLGGKIEKVLKYKINDENERCIIIIRKIKCTEQIYPRKQGKPLKEPL